jgi:tetratricopeptide (TPR) repeat protein
MGVRRYRLCAALIGLCLLFSIGTAADELDIALAEARGAASRHRYADVIELLTPFNSVDDPEARYITAAEIGRAHFHLGNYREANRAFRQAVRLHPERVETALYLEATAYLVGDKTQALNILREVLQSGASDLYLAVTLPGESRFLADPDVWQVLEENSQPFAVDIVHGSVWGVSLGESRIAITENLATTTMDPSSRGLIARAGPHLIWALVFDSDQNLEEIHVHAENLVKYTPYRLQLGDQIDWRTTPSEVMAVLGSPSKTSSQTDQSLSMTWNIHDRQLTLEFGEPRPPRPPDIAAGAAMLRSMQLRKMRAADRTGILDRIDE